MADEKAKQQDKQDEQGKNPAGGQKMGYFIWLIMAVVVIAGATGGFALSQLLGGQPVPAETTEQTEPEKPEVFDPAAANPGQKSWPYDKLDPIVANLDEPGVSRFVRVSVILEMSPKMDPIKGPEFLDEKKVLLQDWMTTYFAGLSLEDVRGSRSLTRIKRDIQDQVNQLLFGSEKTYVERVLFKEFAVQ
ncbi:MAG: flagellar basal body-associated FliL family protein [Sedimentisphaerales bacterium]|nr:flagellar basal body-associated FliL family protein [Sedimentisphaerales bacterium]